MSKLILTNWNLRFFYEKLHYEVPALPQFKPDYKPDNRERHHPVRA